MIIAPRSKWLVGLVLAGAVSGTVGASQTPPAERTPGSATVSGRVIDDDGAPARFAKVELSSRLRNAGIRHDGLTAEDGAFTFDAVLPGTYYLAALKPTYPPAFYSPNDKPVAQPGAAIPIAANQTIQNLTIRVRKGGVIAGKITDQDGEPLSVPIALRRLSPQVPMTESPFYFDVPGYYRSDARGEYRIYGLAPDDYYVMTDNTVSDAAMALPNGRRRTYARTFFPQTEDPMQAVPVTVTSGQERAGINLKIRTVPLLKLSGTIAGPAVSDGYVSLRLIPEGPAALWLQSETTGGSGGHFEFGEVRPGRYWLTAMSNQRPPVDAPRGTPALLWWTDVPIALFEDRTDVVLPLQPAMSISGQVVVDQQPADVPIDFKRYGISPTAIPGTGHLADRLGTSRLTDDGHFTIPNLTPGRYKLAMVAMSGLAPQIVSVNVGGQVLAGPEIEVSAGTNVENVVIRIKIP